MNVFPLSPSTVTWGIQEGCSLTRWLEKLYRWKPVKQEHLLRGFLIDAMLNRQLEANKREEEVTEDDLIEEAIDVFEREKRGYWFKSDPQAWKQKVIGWGLVVCRNFESLVPYEVQGKSFLYLGEDPKQLPLDYKEIKGNPDWVYGIKDWTERSVGKSISIRDLKCLSKTSKSVGKYRLQLFTYASAEYQRGVDVRDVGLEQFNKNSCDFHPVKEDYTRKDYDRVIRTYRQARNHYLNVINGTDDFIIPYRGSGKCSKWSCWHYKACPMGMDSEKAREALKV